MLLGISADFVELTDVMTEAEQKDVVALITGSISRNLTSKTWLRGISDMVEAFNDPVRYGQQWVQNLAGTVVPTGVAQFARAQDPYLREARSVLDKIKDRLPGFKETLPFRRDLFGEPIKLEGGLGPDILSPVYVSTAEDDPAVAEMLRLGIPPSKPTRMIRGVELNAEQYDALQTVTGQTARRLLSTLTALPNWNGLDDQIKADAITDAFRQARDVGRVATVARFPDLATAIAQQQETAQ